MIIENSATTIANTAPDKINLLNFSRSQMVDFFSSLNEPAYRAHQLLQWIHQYGFTDFAAMTNLSKSLRQKLTAIAEIKPLTPALDQLASDGTRKWLLQLDDGNCIETVYIPEATRGTLCVSSQVGCMLNCTFCSTATQGFSRNLSVAGKCQILGMDVRE